MTPEERAMLALFGNDMPDEPIHDDGSFKISIANLAAAIRAAENDALERAGVKRMVEKLEMIAVNFWLMEMSADARSIEALLDETSPASRDKIGAELQRIRALKHKEAT